MDLEEVGEVWFWAVSIYGTSNTSKNFLVIKRIAIY